MGVRSLGGRFIVGVLFGVCSGDGAKDRCLKLILPLKIENCVLSEAGDCSDE